jgi:NitT/TauT family transport system permease protein
VKKHLLSLGSVVGVVLLWELVSRSGWVDAEIFPPLHAILAHVFALLTDSRFLARDLAGSGQRFALGLLCGVPLAILLGVVCGRFGFFSRVLMPLVNFTYPLPKVAVLPLFLVLFGIGDAGKIIFIAVGAFYSVFVNTYSGTLRLKESSLEDLVVVYAIRGKNLWGRVILRGIWGDILVGLKGAVAYALTLVVVSEFTVSNNGLGNFVWRAWDQFRVLDMYAGIFLLCLIGWIFQEILDAALRSATRNNPEVY